MSEASNAAADHHRRAGVAYDAFAAEYDLALAGDLWARRALWRHHRRLFGAGDRVLDIACGTGADALALARRGVRVVAIDLSPGMVFRLRQKTVEAGVRGRVAAVAVNAESLVMAPGTLFDGIVSSFAGVNTMRDPVAFAAAAAALLRPGGRMVLHLLAASPRAGENGTFTKEFGGERIEHRLYSAAQARELFASCFRLRRSYSLDGVLVPSGWLSRLPLGLGAALGRLEAGLGGLPPFLGRGRFLVLDLERREATTAAGAAKRTR